MLTFTLTRLFYTDNSTLGMLSITAKGEELTLTTLELPWRDNIPSISCIPLGHYTIAYNLERKHWYVSGGPAGVTEVFERGGTRWGIRLDKANYAEELKGCIAIGTGLLPHNPHLWMVTNSIGANETLTHFCASAGVDLSTNTQPFPFTIQELPTCHV